MEEAVRVAVEAAREAGSELRLRFGRPMAVASKGRRELVTEMDRVSEATIVRRIRSRFPDDPIMAEEGSPELHASERMWIVDPLDGTNNYAHGYPFFAIAVALEVRGELVAAVVYDPLRDEMFAAGRGLGATLDGAPIHVSDTGLLSESLVATGFPYDRGEGAEDNIGNLGRVILSVRGIRRGGSAALDLAYTACGRLDGFWELGLRTWDVSAGGLLVIEAGGRVTNIRGDTWDHRRGDIVASNARIHDEMRRLVE
jgi:myo-inositol-1(or 4)-monophosphatase